MSNPTIVSRITDAVKRVFGKAGRTNEAAEADRTVDTESTVTESTTAAPGPVGSAETEDRKSVV